MKINIKNYGLIISYIVVNLILTIVMSNLSNLNQENWIKIFMYMSLIQTISGVIIIKILGEKILSLSSAIIIFTYIFHFGHIVLEGFSFETVRVFEWIKTDDIYLVRKVCLVGMKSQLYMIIGIMVYFRKKYQINLKKLQINIQNEIINLKNVYTTGKTLLIIGFPFSAVINYIKIKKFITGGYEDTHLNLSGVLVTISEFVQIGLILMLIGSHKKKGKYYTIMSFLTFYQILIMSTGNRGKQVLIILTIIYLHINLVKKVSLKKLIKVFPIAYIFLIGIRVVGELRLEKHIDFGTIQEKIIYIYKQSIFCSILAEFGNTMLTTYYIVKYESSYNLRIFFNYLNSFLIIIPNFNNFLNKYYLDFIYVENLPKHARFALGGSFIGEAYYSIGEMGFIVLFFIGLFVGYVSKNIEMAIQEKNWIRLSKFILIFPSLLWWIRSYFSTFLREVSWSLLVVIILEKINLNKYINNKIKILINTKN